MPSEDCVWLDDRYRVGHELAKSNGLLCQGPAFSISQQRSFRDLMPQDTVLFKQVFNSCQ
jgi:hypothetical protein